MITFTNEDDDGHVITVSTTDDVTWYPIVDAFIGFLKARGFVINESDVAKYLNDGNKPFDTYWDDELPDFDDINIEIDDEDSPGVFTSQSSYDGMYVSGGTEHFISDTDTVSSVNITDTINVLNTMRTNRK